jgi:hypothetical protein
MSDESMAYQNPKRSSRHNKNIKVPFININHVDIVYLKTGVKFHHSYLSSTHPSYRVFFSFLLLLDAIPLATLFSIFHLSLDVTPLATLSCSPLDVSSLPCIPCHFTSLVSSQLHLYYTMCLLFIAVFIVPPMYVNQCLHFL